MLVNLIAHVPPGRAVMGGPVTESFFKAHIHPLTLAEVPLVTLDFVEFGKELGVGTAGFWRHGRKRTGNRCKRGEIRHLANERMEFSLPVEKGMTSRGPPL